MDKIGIGIQNILAAVNVEPIELGPGDIWGDGPIFEIAGYMRIFKIFNIPLLVFFIWAILLILIVNKHKKKIVNKKLSISFIVTTIVFILSIAFNAYIYSIWGI